MSKFNLSGFMNSRERRVWGLVSLGLLVLAWVVVLPLVSYGKTIATAKGFQVSTLDALSQGVFAGAMTFADLKHHGNFGLGTFVGLDGEMIGLDGNFYQVTADGVATKVSPETETSFAVVSDFKPTQTIKLSGIYNFQALQDAIDAQLVSLNYPYALKIDGSFPKLTVRSVPGQEPPYPTLAEVVKVQTLFELDQVPVTLVGFRLPQNLQGLNVAGYHFHAISRNRQTGGHVLAGEFKNPTVAIQTLADWQIAFPQNSEFSQAPSA